ncbi:flavin prenyltransferase UbiX [Legionella antarctica]|uniref:Flavin prenyltransferase UbiX n=2 Tax=Legionella antarctica TaxID=2708020 RepID=A0A6F8T377_9GAMM|nr:flavin prenyltransferase UbiX [Legionella antarctica]
MMPLGINIPLQTKIQTKLRETIMSHPKKNRLVIGISGATGIIYGVRLLELLKQTTDIETHLVVSKAGHQTRAYETTLSSSGLTDLADFNYNNADIAASISSGSFKTIGMIIAPCSMRTLADIACGTTSTLISRAADVVLKERRRLVVMARESPLNLVHIDNMRRVTEMGGIVAPASPAFYTQPDSIDDLINHSIGRILDLFDIDLDIVKRWEPPFHPKS